MKNNILKKITTFCLVGTMIFSTSAIAFADSEQIDSQLNGETVEVVVFDENDGLDEELTMKRTIDGENINVKIFNSDGNLLVESSKKGDDIRIIDFSDPLNPLDITDDMLVAYSVITDGISDNGEAIVNSGINWGAWTTYYNEFDTHNKTVADMIGVISLFVTNVPASVALFIAQKAIESSYRYITVQVKMRSGTDSTYQYSQEQVTMWGRNSKNVAKTTIYGPGTWTQKKSLASLV